MTKNYHYLTAANGLFAIFVTSTNGEEAMYYTLKDHQGNLAAVIHPDGDVERLSYDAWGRRRNPVGFGYDNLPTPTFDRGFTLHEHYDDFGLINMKFALSESRAEFHLGYAERCKLGKANGRLYDPAVGRMLSPDIVIQQEHNSQAYNRYSYCFNNPLRFTDPSGYVATIPPEFEKYYYPDLIGDYESYKEKLTEQGAENVSYNTESVEGKSTTTISWMVGEDSYQMDIINYSFPLLSQLYANSCMAASLTMQAFRFFDRSIDLSTSTMFKNLVSGMSVREATETALMDSQVGAYENGLRGSEVIELFANASKTYASTSEKTAPYFKRDKSKRDDTYFEGYAFSEMRNNSAVLFTFLGDNYRHTMNVMNATEFKLNGNASGHDLLLWDTDATHGGGRQSFNVFSGKFDYIFGFIPLK